MGMTNGKNKKRLIVALCAIIPILIGTVLYVQYRPDAYVSRLIYRLFNITPNHTIDRSAIGTFIRCYLLDILWAFALPNALFFAVGFDKKRLKLIFVLSIGMVAITEVLQYFKIISGTGDLVDCLLECLSITLAIYMVTKVIKEDRT